MPASFVAGPSMTEQDRPHLERSGLRAHFESGYKPEAAFGIGLEYERFGVVAPSLPPLLTADSAKRGTQAVPSRPSPAADLTRNPPSGGPRGLGSPLPLDGPVSIAALFDALVSRFGWKPKVEDGTTIELSRGASRITLEPGLQMELSGKVHRGLGSAAEEMRTYLSEVRAVSAPLGVAWLAAGTHPTAPLDRIPWLPKPRYQIMRDYLPTRGRLAHAMMKGTCGTQVNLDFTDEADAMAKLRVALTLSSVMTAAFANSPITAGKRNGFLTERGAIWLETDPDRCGLLPFAFDRSASFDDYVEYALSVPMFFLVRNGRYMPLRGVSFGQFLERGYEGLRATREDWELHLTTLFPDVRLKTYLEVRGTDSNAPGLVLAHAAFWKGILYGGPSALESAEGCFAGLAPADHFRLHEEVPKRGLSAQAGGRTLLEIARDLVAIAATGLRAAGEPGEEQFLDPLRELWIERGITPAEDLLERLGGASKPDPAHLVTLLSRLDLVG